MIKIIKNILIFIPCFIFGVIFHGLAAGALFYCSFSSAPALRAPLAFGYLLVILVFIIFNRKHTRAFFLTLLPLMIVFLWFASIEPKTGGKYPPELTLPHADIKGDIVTVYDVRNNDYRTRDDFDVRYEKRTYNLKDLKTLDVLVNYWGMDAIAHTFLSYGFSDGRYLAVSVEIRPEIGKAYDMFQGFFKQYHLIYIWGDERDLVRTRTNYRKETAYLYRTTFSSDETRKMFLSMMQATNSIYLKPQFYNTLTHSCTNTLGNHIIATKIRPIKIWERRFLTGDVDKRMYKNGLIQKRGLPFAELRKQASIDSRAIAADKDPDFSEKIRTHLK